MKISTGYQTQSRAKIMEYLQRNAQRTVTVSEIEQYMNASENPVNITTIYRYLDKLVKEGTISKFVSGSGDKAGYQLTEHVHCCKEHLHIQCDGCGKVVHIDCGFMDEIAEHFLKHHGFSLDCAGTILHGLCENCRNEG
ncbi:MAG: Fur family transcriptional regulator [Lachnospiraceae bacterium]